MYSMLIIVTYYFIMRISSKIKSQVTTHVYIFNVHKCQEKELQGFTKVITTFLK